MSDEQEEVPWELRYVITSQVFGQECARLRNTYPYPIVPPHTALSQIIRHMATELWDQNFSLSEIRQAFDYALTDLPRYAAGYERRSDEGRRPLTGLLGHTRI